MHHLLRRKHKMENVGKSKFHGKVQLLRCLRSAYDGLVFTTENYIKEKDFIVEFVQIVFKKKASQKRVPILIFGILRMI